MAFLRSSQSYFLFILLFFDFTTLFMSQHNNKKVRLKGEGASHPPSLNPSSKSFQQNPCKVEFYCPDLKSPFFSMIKCVQSMSKTINSQPQPQQNLLFAFACLFLHFPRFSMHILPKGKPNHMIQQYQMKKQLVNIDFKKDQGLILKWNYTDLTKRTKYFRHIIVLLTSDQQFAKNAVQDYVRYLKQGDLYTAIYCSDRRVMKIKDWREKTTRAHFSVDAYLSQPLHSSFSFQLAAGLFEQEIEEMCQPTILNFVLQKQEQIINLKNRIVDHQVQLKNKFITTIFSPLPENKLSICSGINTLSTRQPQVFSFYHQYINQMAIQRAHMVITCRNGEISSCNQQEWRNTAFNKVERTYYGPSVRYAKDVLHFTNARIMHIGLYELQISLEYKCFGGKIYTSQKKIGIHFNHNELYNRTVCSVLKARVFCPVEEIELEENPYQSETVILFDKIKEGRCKEDI